MNICHCTDVGLWAGKGSKSVIAAPVVPLRNEQTLSRKNNVSRLVQKEL